MRRYCIATLCAIGLVFSIELRTACDVHAGYRHGDYGNYGQAGLRLIVPMSEYVGLTAGILDCGFAGGSIRISTGNFGFIEKIPTEHISPYLTQTIVLDIGASLLPHGYGYIDFAVGIGIGVEFLSSKAVCPFIEGTYTFYTGIYDGYLIGISAGVRANL